MINFNGDGNAQENMLTQNRAFLYGDAVFDTIISPSVKNKESRAMRLPLAEYDPKHNSSLQFAQLAKEFVKRVGVVNE